MYNQLELYFITLQNDFPHLELENLLTTTKMLFIPRCLGESSLKSVSSDITFQFVHFYNASLTFPEVEYIKLMEQYFSIIRVLFNHAHHEEEWEICYNLNYFMNYVLSLKNNKVNAFRVVQPKL
jgi:hypothetical protein